MDEFLVIAGIVLAIAVGYAIIMTMWPVLLIGLIIWIIVVCVKKHNAEQQKLEDAIRAQEAARRTERANKAREDNSKINMQISQCRSEQDQFLNQVRIAEKQLFSVETFLKMFVAFGADDGPKIIAKQRNELYTVQSLLTKKQAEEKELQDKIKENQKIIDAAS